MRERINATLMKLSRSWIRLSSHFPVRSLALDSAVDFGSSGLAVPDAVCPICQRITKTLMLQVTSDAQLFDLVSCECGTVFYPNAQAPDYGVVEGRESFFMRIDQTESIDASARPLFSSPELASYPVVDIGCGVGFTTDFVRFMGRESAAFDPSASARLSTQLLGIDIRDEMATSESITVKGPRLVFASEVIEHVEQPEQFLRELKAIAGENGYLIVTTPNAEFVKLDAPRDTLLAMLAPSQHLFLLSTTSLARLARSVGFSWVHTWTDEERLFLICGPKKVELSNNFSRATYIEYLTEKLANASEIRIDLRIRSFGYRLFKELVHAGRYEEADRVFDQITDSYADLGIDLKRPQDVIAKYRAAAGTSVHLPAPEFFPINVPLIYFLRGTLAIALYHDRISAGQFFRAAKDLADLYREVFTDGVVQAYDIELQRVTIWVDESIALHHL
jgi:2-polyprenyl-3-methyl-5-hydroxy-6-metoxy-1,4-benzoquinol methylase